MDTQIIDAVALIRQIRDENAQRLQGKTHAERIAYYREQARKMRGKISVSFADRVTISVPQARL